MTNCNKYVINIFLETLKQSHGHFTDQTVHRAGKIVGSTAKALDNVYEANISETKVRKSYKKKLNYHDDILRFLTDYKDEKLFTNTPGRFHASFENFRHSSTIRQPNKLKARRKYGKKLDSSVDVYQ